MGYNLLNNSQKIANENSKQSGMEFLLIAEKYYSFHACVTLNKYDIENLLYIYDNQEADNIIAKILQREKTLQLHGTPGYLNIAKTYISISVYYQQLNNNQNKNNYPKCLSTCHTKCSNCTSS